MTAFSNRAILARTEAGPGELEGALAQKVVVIGAGIVGLTLAWSLERRGWQVTVLEARSPGYGASRVNAGRICPTHGDPVPAPGLVRQSLEWMRHSDSPLYIQPRPSPDLARFLYIFWRHCNQERYDAGSAALQALGRDTIAQLDAIRASGVDFEEHARGTLHVYESLERLDKSFLHASDFLTGETVEISAPMTGDEVRHLEPALSDLVVGGFLVEEDRLIRSDTLTAGLAAISRNMGSIFAAGLK